MIQTIKIVIEGEVDEITLQRIPGEGYAAKDIIEACFVLKDDGKEFRIKSKQDDWAAIQEQCGVAMSGDVVSIAGDISVEGVLVNHAGELTLENTKVNKVEPSFTDRTSVETAASRFTEVD